MTKIKQDRTNQDKIKIGPVFDFLLHFSIFLLENFSKASQLSWETMFKISSKNIKKCRRITKKGPILVLSYQDRTKIADKCTVKMQLLNIVLRLSRLFQDPENPFSIAVINHAGMRQYVHWINLE